MPIPFDEEAVVSESKQQVSDTARARRINKEVMEKFMQCIDCGIEGNNSPIPILIPKLRQAVYDQNIIGMHKLLQGYMPQ